MQQALVRKASLQFKARDYEMALKTYDQALAMTTDDVFMGGLFPDAYAERGKLHIRLQNFEQAVNDLSSAIELAPQRVVCYLDRAVALRSLHRYAEAEVDFRRALYLEPSLVAANNDYAWFLATCPDPAIQNGELAVAHARKAVALAESPNFEFYDTLAAAFARAGDFASAIEWEKKCIAVAPAAARGQFLDRLQLYERRQPFVLHD